MNPETTNGARKWMVTLAVGTGVFLATLDGSIVNVALPTMVASLKTNFAVIQWVVLAYLLTVTTLMLGFGRLGDIFGKKRIYQAGFTVFTTASALCGLAPSVYVLIGLRIAQGAGAAMTMALGPAILVESYPPNERGRAMGIIGAVVSIGIVTGPALGGAIVHMLSWHWIFFVNVPIGLSGIWMVRRFIPNVSPARKQKFDLMGALILLAALACLLVGLSLGQQRGFGDMPVLVLLSFAIVFLLVFIQVELRSDHPMVNLGLFQNLLLCANLVSGFIAYAAISGILILLPFYLEGILGYPTLKVGLMMCVIPVMMGIFAPVSGALSDSLGSRPITLLGLAVLFAGYLAAATLDGQTGEFGFVVRIVLIGVGSGLFVSPNNSAIMGAGDKHQLGITSGLMAISRTLGQTVGVSIMGALWTIRVRMLAGDWRMADVIGAPVSFQVQGLHFIFMFAAAMIAAGFFISVYGMVLERRRKNSRRGGDLSPESQAS